MIKNKIDEKTRHDKVSASGLKCRQRIYHWGEPGWPPRVGGGGAATSPYLSFLRPCWVLLVFLRRPAVGLLLFVCFDVFSSISWVFLEWTCIYGYKI